MKFYIEIGINPNHEHSLYALWSLVYSQLHLALVSVKDTSDQVSIGVNFPEYYAGKPAHRLGSRLRLFAHSEAELLQLELEKRLQKIAHCLNISSVLSVPRITTWVVVHRVHPRASMGALARRYAKRSAAGKHGEQAVTSVEEALQRLQDYTDTPHQLGFIALKSLSTRADFHLVVRQDVVDSPQSGLFSTYGLSKTTTLPHW